ncbi:hypothetical protein [Streptomyces sp. TR06-5]|uniref:hypothetical protein n=1 Tax=unclassified Streptomyces TaxID=2593676 RepID=UPI0039A3DB20
MVTTVEDYVAGHCLEFVGAAPVAPEGQAVEHLAWCGDWNTPRGGRPGRRFMALLPAADAPEDLNAPLRSLRRQGAVAIALVGPRGTLDRDALGTAARAAGLVVLAAPESLSPVDTMGLLMGRQNAVHRQHHETAREMFRLTDRAYRRGEGPRRLLDHVARRTGARIDVLTRGDRLWAELGDHEPLLAQLAEGSIASTSFVVPHPPTAADAVAASETGEWHVSLHALQGIRPHPVMVARTPGRFTSRTAEVLSQAAVQAGMLRDAWRRAELSASAAATRTAVLQYLLMGETVTATRVSERLAPGVLTADTGRVAILECGPGEDRSAVSEDCLATLSPALVAPCPAYDRHLILALPGGEHAGPERPALRQLVSEGRAIGVSPPCPWSRTVLAYQAAFHALSAARGSEAGVAIGRGEPLAALLPPAARAWGREMQRRLETLPAQHREITVHTARIALAHGDAKAAKLLGVPRTTAGGRLDGLMAALGLRRGSLIHRAVADLALQLASLHEDDASPPDGGDTAELAPLLTESSAARAWAEEFLAPLTDHQLDALTAWLAADGHALAAADRLSIGRNSVARRLSEASVLLARELRGPGEGPHDPLWALMLTGRLSTDLLPREVPA